MSLRTALAALPDDRATVYAVREIVAFFAEHAGEQLPVSRVERVTGVEHGRLLPVLKALAAAAVIDCDGEPGLAECVFHPDAVLQLEVERFLRSGNTPNSRMQSSIGKFRTRMGRG
jgi:hypothetical protein